MSFYLTLHQLESFLLTSELY